MLSVHAHSDIHRQSYMTAAASKEVYEADENNYASIISSYHSEAVFYVSLPIFHRNWPVPKSSAHESRRVST